MGARPYLKLALLLVAGVAAVLALCHAMVADALHIRFSLHHLYLAVMVMSPLGVLMLFLLGEIFRDRRLNTAMAGVFALLFTGAFLGQRDQAGVRDQEAVAALIGHHSNTLHVCEQARLSDPRVIALCDRIGTLHAAHLDELHGILADQPE